MPKKNSPPQSKSPPINNPNLNSDQMLFWKQLASTDGNTIGMQALNYSRKKPRNFELEQKRLRELQMVANLDKGLESAQGSIIASKKIKKKKHSPPIDAGYEKNHREIEMIQKFHLEKQDKIKREKLQQQQHHDLHPNKDPYYPSVPHYGNSQNYRQQQNSTYGSRHSHSHQNLTQYQQDAVEQNLILEKYSERKGKSHGLIDPFNISQISENRRGSPPMAP